MSNQKKKKEKEKTLNCQDFIWGGFFFFFFRVSYIKTSRLARTDRYLYA